MGRKLKIAIAIVAALVIYFIGIWVGITAEAARQALNTVPEASKVYGVEIWADGTAEIKTYIPHIQQIDERTLIVTDKDMETVANDVKAAIERGDIR